ncbi:MAG: ComEC/Rec2-related protein [Myxococcota bacterium]|jgi:ComEC/Rec2-related protein
MNSWRHSKLLQLAFCSYLLAALLLYMLPWHRDYADTLALYLSGVCCLLAIASYWLFINTRIMLILAMACLAYLHQPPQLLLQKARLHPVTLHATVSAITVHSDYVKIMLRDISSDDNAELNTLKELRAINSNNYCNLEIGERIAAQGILEQDGRWLSLKKISYRSLKYKSFLPFDELRHWVQLKLKHLFQGNELGIARALILADKSSLDDLLKSGYRNFGLLHLLAVSGMHFWLWNAFLRRILGYRFNRLRLPILVIAALLAGFGPAVSRALGFIVVRDLAAMRFRNFSAMRLLAIVGLSELLLFANSPFGLGYLLSYSATIAIIVCSDKVNDSNFKATMRCSWAAFFATMPVIHNLQATIEFFSIIFSPIFAIFTTARLFIILASLALPVQPLSQFLLSAISSLETRLITLCDLLPGTPLLATTSSQVAITVIAIIALALALPLQIAPPKMLKRALVVLAIGLFAYRPAQRIGISMVNVGHGLGVVINGEQRSVGFDLGSKTLNANRLVDSIYFKELLHNKWPAPTEFIFSHRDDDHVNGMPALHQRLAVRELSHSEALELQLAPWTVTVYRTRGDLKSTANDNGFAIDLRYQQQRIVVLGDQDGSALFELARYLSPGPVDIMFSPHHGLSTDGLAMMIEHLRPNELWASCAPINFPLPAQEIAQHYGIPLLHTAAGPLRKVF